ncbi:EamA family transporter [Patescibacteria group bacterium]|nr:EamA family transporter [Patescibacteria group bacterium]
MINWIIPLSLLIIFEALADIFAKNWSLQKYTWLAIVSLSLYLIANSFWLFALKNGAGLSRGAIVFSVASAIIAILLGVIFYKEPVSKLQLIGFFIGLISLILIFWE